MAAAAVAAAAAAAAAAHEVGGVQRGYLLLRSASDTSTILHQVRMQLPPLLLEIFIIIVRFVKKREINAWESLLKTK